jgi:2-methylcitrate dehydratase
MIRKQIEDFGGNPLTSLIGGGRTALDRAAFYNSALIRYLDYNDSYLAKKETCHPSDHAGNILAAAEYADKNGNDFLAALTIAYQVQCGLSDVAPMRDKDFDHTVQGAYGTAAGVAFALGLDADKTAHAIAISGTAYNALRVTRTGNLSHWKGLAFPSTGWTSTHSAFLAMQGITGPEEIFEGNKGFKEAIEGEFTIDWQKEDLEKVKKTIIKKYNAEIHSQSILEGVQELVQSNSFSPDDIEKIDLNTFNVAYHIIGGGEEGSKKNIRTKEEADHSLPYMIAAMILDGNVLPAQYLPKRILKEEFQKLLTRVQVKEMKAYSDLFPNAMACDLTIYLKNGRQLHVDKKDYEGFFTRPASRETVICKFKTLCNPFVDEKKSDKIIATVKDLKKHNITELMETLRTLK